MKTSQRFGKWQELRQRINVPLIWQLLAIFQIIVLVTFFLTWPPVTLTLVLPSPEAEHWSSLIEDFHAKNPDIRIALVKGSYTTDEVKGLYTFDFQEGSQLYELVYMQKC